MTWFSILAQYFICWWITLFMVLPIGLRTQGDEKSVVSGTVESAPARFRPGRVFLLNSAVAVVIYAIWYVATEIFGLSAMSIPRIVPTFS